MQPAHLLWDIALWLHLFSPKRSRSELPLPRYRKSMKGLLTVLFFRQGWNMKLASFVFVCCRHTSKSSAAVERVSTTYYYLSRWLSFVVLKKKWEVFLRSELDPKCKIPFYTVYCMYSSSSCFNTMRFLGSISLLFSTKFEQKFKQILNRFEWNLMILDKV